MELYFFFVTFIFGAIIGSFLDVVAYRLHTGKSLNGRSHCLSCGMTLRWYELIPVVSFLALRATCRTCKARIPLRCFLMEVITGLTFLLMYYLHGDDVVLLVTYFGIAALLILIVAYDLRHTIIPDELVLALLAFSLGVVTYAALMGEGQLGPVLSHVAAGLAGGAFLGSFWLISGGKWMGLGDAKLMVPLGILLGPWGTFGMLVLSFWIGAAISLALILVEKLFREGTTRVSFFGAPLKIRSEIPFAPFLVLGFSLVHFFHVDIFEALGITYPF
jgi:leader peptidase (prepilin peptidase) / N-methyltransferase